MLFLLALIDLLCALALALLFFGHPVYPLQAGAALLLLAKGLLFIKNILSIVDMIIALLMFMLIWVATPPVAVALALYLGVKGVASFF
jgi:hypothetical protein